jgi:hypothetical protein
LDGFKDGAYSRLVFWMVFKVWLVAWKGSLASGLASGLCIH